MAMDMELCPRVNRFSLAFPEGPFTFNISLNKSATGSRLGDVLTPIEDETISTIKTTIIRTTSSFSSSASSSSSSSFSSSFSSPPSSTESEHRVAPIERLPSELHTQIASYLTLPSLIVNLAWTSRRLYSSLGPTNCLLWYKILYRRLADIPCNLSCPLVPRFSNNVDYYQRCLAIMCHRSGEKACQRCLLVDDGVVGGGTGAPGVVGGGGGGKNEEKGVQLVDIYVAGVYGGTWCWECAKQVYESTAIINLRTPLPSIPETLLTTIYLNPSSTPKPGFFVSRTAIAEAIKEQCPNGGYTPLNISWHAEPDIREAKPYVIRNIMILYKKWYQHLHILCSPKELGMEMKKSFDIKKFKMNADSCVQNDLIDAVFGVAGKYLASKEIEDEEKREEERMEACKKFLSMFFGVPNTTKAAEFKMAVPTTRFLAFIAKRFWIAKMKEVRKGSTLDLNGKNCVDDKPKRRCGYCVLKAEEEGDLVTQTYSPILLVCHMLSEHSKRMLENWPEVPNLKKVQAVMEKKVEENKVEETKIIKRKLAREKKKGTLEDETQKSGFDGESIEDIRFLFESNVSVDIDTDADAEGEEDDIVTNGVGQLTISDQTGTDNHPIIFEQTD